MMVQISYVQRNFETAMATKDRGELSALNCLCFAHVVFAHEMQCASRSGLLRGSVGLCRHHPDRRSALHCV